MTLFCTTPIIHLLCTLKFCITALSLIFLGITVAPREIEDNDYTLVVVVVVVVFFFGGGGGTRCIMGNVQMVNKRIADK